MITVFDKETGQAIEVSEADAEAGYRAGRFGLPKGRIEMVREDGSFFNVDSSEADIVFGQGARLATDEDRAAEDEREKFSALPQRALANLEAAAAGATLGLSTAAEVGLGVDPSDIRKRRKHAPEAVVSELAGATLPVLFSGGAAAPAAGARAATLGARAARAATAIPRGAATLGRAVESQLGARLGAGIAGRAAAAGAAGVVEGGLAGLGQGIQEVALTEASLGDPGKAAEQLMTAAARGAVFGGAATSVLTGAGVGASKAFKSAAHRIFKSDSIEKAIRDSVDSATVRQFGPQRGHVRKARQLFKGDPDRVITAAIQDEGIEIFGKSYDELLAASEAARAKWGSKFGDVMEAMDDAVPESSKLSLNTIRKRLLSEVIGPLKKSTSPTVRRAASKVDDELGAIMQTGLDLPPAATVSRAVSATGPRTQASPLLSVPKKRVGPLGELIDEADSAVAASVSGVARETVPGRVPMTSLLTPKAARDRIGFTELHRMRVELDKAAFPLRAPGTAPTAPTFVQRELQKARRVIEDELERAADSAADNLVTGLGTDYRQAKEKFAVFNYLRDVSDNAVLREQSNRAISLTDTIAGAGGMSAGAFSALASADPTIIGGLTMAALGGVASTLVNKLVREKGAGLVAKGGNRLLAMSKTIGEIQRRTDGAFAKFSEAARRSRDATAIAAGGVLSSDRKGSSRDERFAARISELESAVGTRPDMMGLEAEAPTVSSEMQAVQTRAKRYLAMVAPKVPQVKGRQPSVDMVPESDKLRFLRRARAADDFMTVIQDIENGVVTPQAIEAAETVYPKAFGELRKSFSAQTTDEAVEKMDPAQRLQASLVAGRPVHFTLEPGFISAAQQVFRDRASGQNQEGISPSRATPPDTAHLEQTRTDTFL